MHSPLFYIATLGCKVNQYESEALREAWQAKGWLETDQPEAANLILVNSCAITARAVADTRQTVRRLHRAAPSARIILTGCAAQLDEADTAKLPGLAAVIPQSAKDALLNTPNNADFSGKLPASAPAAPEKTPPFPPFSIAGFTRSRPILKVQDGCSHRCTFCIVPLARGKARSRSFDDTADELQRLLQAGFREIVLAGVNLRQFGPDLPPLPGAGGPPDFWDLLNFLEDRFAGEWAGRARLRLSSLEPGQLNEKALESLGKSRMLCPHLHLSLQSGSPDVLRRMGRGHYSVDGLPAFFDELSRHWPVFGLGADFLVGFPGESEADFMHTYALADKLPMTYAHVFPYSARPDTPAARMDGRVEKAVAAERAARLRALLDGKKAAFAQRLLERGKELRIAPEGGRGRGLCEFYVSCEFTPAPGGNASALSSGPSPELSSELLCGMPFALRKGRLLTRS